MKVFYDESHPQHAPTWYVADGCVRPTPEVPARTAMMASRLSELPEFELLPPLPVDTWPAIRSVHDHGYLDYLRTIHDLWTAEFGACDVLPDTMPRSRSVRRPTKPSAQAGYYCFDMAAPITAGTWAAAFGAASCAASAAHALLSGDRAAIALTRPPGHHAGRDYCGGFCYLNNIAIAAEYLRKQGDRFPRVAILDIDYHHGNGTQDIFYGRDDVLFVSIHADPNTQYPYFWGHAEETGEGAGEGFNVNFPLRRNCSEGEWLTVLTQACERILAFGATAVFISVGLDIGDGDSVGDFHITHKGFREIGRTIAGLNLPTAFVQEGGYAVDQLSDQLIALLFGFASA